MFDSHSSIYHR